MTLQSSSPISNTASACETGDEIEWRSCYYADRYEVSSHGFVRNAKTKRVLKAYIVKGYFRLSLRLEPGSGKQKGFLVHRLVLLSFHGESPDPEKKFGAHLNGNSLDNRIENLAWKDWQGNHDDKVRHGTSSAKLTEEDVMVIRNHYANGVSQANLARRYKVDPSYICRIVRGHRWRRTQ